jgi:hypothetical protein
MPILSIFNTDLGEIQCTSFPHNALEIGEVFETRCNESCAVLNGATEILSLFSGCSSLFGENSPQKSPQNLGIASSLVYLFRM